MKRAKDESTHDAAYEMQCSWNVSRAAYDVAMPDGRGWKAEQIRWFVQMWWQHLASASMASYEESLDCLSAWAEEHNGLGCIATWLQSSVALHDRMLALQLLELLEMIRMPRRAVPAALPALIALVEHLARHGDPQISETAERVAGTLASQESQPEQQQQQQQQPQRERQQQRSERAPHSRPQPVVGATTAPRVGGAGGARDAGRTAFGDPKGASKKKLAKGGGGGPLGKAQAGAPEAQMAKRPRVPGRPFTVEEDASIWVLRHEGLGWEDIGRRLGGERTGDHVRLRYGRLDRDTKERAANDTSQRPALDGRRDEGCEAEAEEEAAETASYCFCGTDRHLPSSELPFEGVWIFCETCRTWCHGECAGVEAALDASDYQCPPCSARAAGSEA